MDKDISQCNISLERDVFLRDLLRNLSGALQDVIGIDEASGFISIVGQKMGDTLNSSYKQALNVQSLNKEQVASVLVDLKQRIEGNFRIEYQDNEKIVLTSTSCPFAEKVVHRPSLCMMTSNVFGTITAENLGYAKVFLEKTIAQGDEGCKIVIYLHDTHESMNVEGNEYYQNEIDDNA